MVVVSNCAPWEMVRRKLRIIVPATESKSEPRQDVKVPPHREDDRNTEKNPEPDRLNSKCRRLPVPARLDGPYRQPPKTR